jgi:hypothetical protein
MGDCGDVVEKKKWRRDCLWLKNKKGDKRAVV